MQLTKKCLIPIENSKSIFHYVLSMHDIDKILEKKNNIFQTLILLERAITNIIKINVGKRKIKSVSTMQKIVRKFAKCRKFIIKKII